MLPSSSSSKNKEVLSIMMGKNEGSGLGFVSKYLLIDGSCQLSLLNMALVCIESVGWGIHLSHWVTATTWVIMLLWVIQRIPRSSSYYRWVFMFSSSQMLPSLPVVPSQMFERSQPRVMSIILCQSCSNSVLLYHTTICILFRVVDGGNIMALLRRISSCRRQHIIQEEDLGTFQCLRACMP